MTPSADCYELIKHFEGCRLEAYPDPGTGAAPWTVGYGCTTGVTQGMTVTQEQADEMLRQEVNKFANQVTGMVTAEIEQCMFDALVSFAYNVGAENLRRSTLLRLVNKNSPDAWREFQRWTRAAGKILPGLITRRNAEAELFKGNHDWKDRPRRSETNAA